MGPSSMSRMSVWRKRLSVGCNSCLPVADNGTMGRYTDSPCPRPPFGEGQMEPKQMGRYDGCASPRPSTGLNLQICESGLHARMLDLQSVLYGCSREMLISFPQFALSHLHFAEPCRAWLSDLICSAVAFFEVDKLFISVACAQACRQ
jgi:hypothetical protein